ncbi:MAG: pirin family protein [Rickettsiales bacterium]|nr:pirin family protein [Rickettsiales bacterium]
MIKIYPCNELGGATYDWLKTKHHFSFADYYNQDRMAFGKLRVINDDIIKADSGFGMHPHRNMEIITYVRTGAITHRDNQGNEGVTKAGNVQVMSAGSGIIHSEFNNQKDDTTLYQIWIETNQKGVKPRWDSYEFPKSYVKNQLKLLVSGDKKAPLFIYQDAFIYAGLLKAGCEIKHKIHNQIYILASKGEFKINDKVLKKGDGAEVTNLSEVTISAIEESEILVIDVPNANN